MPQTSRPSFANARRLKPRKECRKLVTNFYPTGVETVDTIFYPVVPDSFMHRDGGTVSKDASERSARPWPGELARFTRSSQDRWSF
jgi:hypothetical protein